MPRLTHKDKPIYTLTNSHTTKAGTSYDSGTWVWLHEINVDGSIARISPYNRKIGLPANKVFNVPATILKPLS